eukprot:scaffold4394_cov113-Isochrysis_galbana.AAC.5
MRRVVLLQLRLQLADLLLELRLLDRRPHARRARHLALHQLQLEVGRVDELLLPLRLGIQLRDLVGRVARHALSSGNLGAQIGFPLPLLTQRARLAVDPLLEFGLLARALFEPGELGRVHVVHLFGRVLQAAHVLLGPGGVRLGACQVDAGLLELPLLLLDSLGQRRHLRLALGHLGGRTAER